MTVRTETAKVKTTVTENNTRDTGNGSATFYRDICPQELLTNALVFNIVPNNRRVAFGKVSWNANVVCSTILRTGSWKVLAILMISAEQM